MDDPIALLRQHLARASDSEDFDASRVALATVDGQGRPTVRFVLVRQIESEGLFFYTNYESDKARHLDDSPYASLAWHWSTIGVQARAEGYVARTSAERSDSYFASRERESQIGAWASAQSRPLESREALEKEVQEIRKRFAGEPVPRPPFWGGYVLRPTRIELWHNGEHRLHDRFRYDRDGDGDGDAWRKTRLAP